MKGWGLYLIVSMRLLYGGLRCVSRTEIVLVAFHNRYKTFVNKLEALDLAANMESKDT